jgi:hypothetical protein
MTEAHESTFDDHDKLTHHRQRIIDLFTEKYPDVLNRLRPTTIDLMTQALAEIEKKYAHFPYHNQEHTYDVIDRGFEWLLRLEEELGQPLTDEDIEVVAIAASYHDFHLEKEVREDGVELSPERRSAIEAADRMHTYPVETKQRVFGAILSTEVSVNDDEVIQINVATGERDIAVTAVARADVGTVYNKSDYTYYSDIGRLMAEKIIRKLFGNQTPAMSAINVALKQTDFVIRRWRDLEREDDHLHGVETTEPSNADENHLGIPGINFRRAMGRAAAIEMSINEHKQEIERIINESADNAEELALRFTGIIANIFTKSTD